MACEHILLIDDDEDDRDFFVLAIQDFSPYLQCSYFNDAEKALHALIAGALKPEIIFLDLNMPLMNGQDFLKSIKKQNTLAEIPVIVYTTSSDPHTIQSVKALGAHHFITKPTNLNTLKDLLEPFIA